MQQPITTPRVAAFSRSGASEGVSAACARLPLFHVRWSELVNIRERAEVKDEQTAGQGDGASQVDASQTLDEPPETGSSLVALCGLGLAVVAMFGWICALAWIGWRLLNWLLF
jgi:hypothetical protein